MSYNYNHQNLSAQQQEILRQKERDQQRKLQEAKEENRLKEEAVPSIIEFLHTQDKPVSQNDILEATNLNSLDITKALRLLKSGKVIDSVHIKDKVSHLESFHYFIKVKKEE